MARLLFAMLLSLALSAVAQIQPTLIISFDENFDGLGQQGPVRGTLDGKPALVSGKVGRALKSGPDTGYLLYPTEGVLNREAGTVELWVCPLDWLPGDNEFHVFFDVRGEGAFYLYKFHLGVRLLMLTCDDLAGPYLCSSFDLDWKPGEWHHIAGTWGLDGVMAYVDGKPAAKTPTAGPLPGSLGATFRIGDHPWHLPRTSSSLIDEVRIYDRALSPAHIAAHFRGDYNFASPLTPEALVLRTEVDPAAEQVIARLSTGGADVEDARLAASLALVPKGQELPADAVVASFTNGQLTRRLPLPVRQPGEYEVVAGVLLDGAQVAEVRGAVTVPSFEWRDNDLGEADVVLPPWTPVELKNDPRDTVSCWGRDYVFARRPLPAQIVSANQELLARPAELKMSKQESPVVWKASELEVARSETGTRVEITGAMVGAWGEEAVRAEVRSVLEYDGLLLVDLSLPESGAFVPDRVSIEIPLQPDHAIYRHRWAPSWEGLTGNLPAGRGAVDQDRFIPYYWLGDNDRGLFWFCESDQMWPNAEAPNAVEVVREGDAVVLRLNLLAPGQELPLGWKFTFGLQATPVKPLPRDWRKWRLQPGRNANVSIIWPTPDKNSLRYYGYPEATDPELFAQRVAGLHQNGVKAVPYLCLTFLSTAAPEWPFFARYWAMGPVDTSASDVTAYGAGFAMASPLGKDWADFIIWKNKQFIDRYGIDGVYHDNTHPYSSANLDAGVGYQRDGRRRPTFPILGYRALYRRMYALIKALPRQTFTMAHMSGKVTIPILAYDDSYLDGEHFRGRVKDSYMDLLTLDVFRAEFMGRQWGIMPFFLPEFDSAHAAQIEPTRGLMALLMIHDTALWPAWCNTGVANEALAALDEFGYVDADFIPYFDPTPPATTDMPDVFISAYKRADGRALLIVANLSREDREGDVTVNGRRLGVALDGLMSWPDRWPLEATGGRVHLTVPRLGYRMVVAGGE